MSNEIVDDETGPSGRPVNRRTFVARIWKAGFAAIAGAGIWTSFDVLGSVAPSGLGGVVKTVGESEVTDAPVYVRDAQTYITSIGDEVVALWQRCPHLGCRVAWCESSREFECPCHGSKFNRAGEVRSGPSPRGMDRFKVDVTGGIIEVDTGAVTEGAPPGAESIDEPPAGPSCLGGEA